MEALNGAILQQINGMTVAQVDPYDRLKAGTPNVNPYYTDSQHADKALVASHLYGVPAWIPWSCTIEQLIIHVNTAGAGGTKARLGIYKNGANLYPGDLLVDAGEVAVDITGAKTAAINQVIHRGLYFLAVISDGAPEIVGDTFLLTPLGFEGASLDYVAGMWDVAQAYGALPDPFTGGGSAVWGPYRIGWRISTAMGTREA